MSYIVTEKSTMHGIKTPHGYSTPHRYPVSADANVSDIFSELARQLYPTGRAWYMKRNSIFFNIHKAINRSFIRLIDDSKFTIDSLFPDNVNFSEDDASLWEYRLGLITNPLLSLEVRKMAILRKMAYPSNIKARQHPLFIESQLQAAGFDVYVYDNTPPYRTPNDIIATLVTETQHGPPTQHGLGTQHGGTGFEVIANLSTPNESFSVGNLYATFFIGGATLGATANVPANRLTEFKELVLRLKPAQTVVFTFLNYT